MIVVNTEANPGLPTQSTKPSLAFHHFLVLLDREPEAVL